MEYQRTFTADELEAAYGFILSQAIPVDRNGYVPRIAVFQVLNHQGSLREAVGDDCDPRWLMGSH